ncbi:hypothetical protein HXX76_001859 [Chlamydomonas incerta]|uniref:Phosphatidic acid phosphatase type 2/haloperoxidase domain-containing protein n=1 Tax=Chlamydomonas incerta TaxID=51695 RepID=A0A835TG56_CHLIN|nr:hypothetical protein HXX76_001859 [Chlamydomonas incerta]|eukprot:KAG2443506.1 hypothetical protein HXX76_001859 [Chlamydomonas incerta]
MRAFAIALAVGLALLAAPATALLQQSVITRWVYASQNVARSLALTNQITSRLYAQVSVAQYDAYKTSLQFKVSKKAPTAPNPDLAAAFAAHAVLARFAPQLAPNPLDNLLLAEVVRADVSTKVRDASAAIGVGCALKYIKIGVADRSLTVSYYRPPAANDDSVPDNVYKFTQAVPEYNQTEQNFILYPQYSNGSTFIYPVKNLPTLTAPYLNSWYKKGSSEFEAETQELLKVGGVVSERTAYQNDTAKFWLGAVGSGGGGSAGLTGMVQNISITILPATYSVYDQAKFFAKLGSAFYDGTITVWYVKYHALRWRPITALRKYYNPNWAPYLATPQHPEYPSAHQGIFGGGWGVLERAVGAAKLGNVTFTVRTDWPGIPDRTYTNLADAADECLSSRVYAGAHWRKAAADAFHLGYDVAGYIYDNLDKILYGSQEAPKW